MINKVTLIGNLGRDAEVRRLESGAVVAKFAVATNENYRDKSGEWQTQTEWHDVVVWNLLAERAERDFKKGKMVYVEGKLTHRKYEDKDGNPRKITEVKGNVIRLLERRDSSNFPTEEDAPPMTNNNTPTTVNEPAATTTTAAKGKESEAEDDLPF